MSEEPETVSSKISQLAEIDTDGLLTAYATLRTKMAEALKVLIISAIVKKMAEYMRDDSEDDGVGKIYIANDHEIEFYLDEDANTDTDDSIDSDDWTEAMSNLYSSIEDDALPSGNEWLEYKITMTRETVNIATYVYDPGRGFAEAMINVDEYYDIK